MLCLRITLITLRPSSGEIEMRKSGILASIILFLPSMLVAQIGGRGQPAANTKHAR